LEFIGNKETISELLEIPIIQTYLDTISSNISSEVYEEVTPLQKLIKLGGSG
tara:strand:+ start:612 stop:767 length:156 start_codon:yes stop_codon:yes gene_type:complete